MTPENGTGYLYEGGMGTSFLVPSVTFAQPSFVRGADLGGESALWIGGRDSVEVVQPSAPYDHLATIPVAYSHAGDHELGGGTRVRSVFLLDLDGDGSPVAAALVPLVCNGE